MVRINVGVESEGKKNVYLESIPESIKGRIHADGFKQLITTQKNRKKSQLLLQELLFYLDTHANALVQQENLAVFTWIDSLLNSLNAFIYHLTRYEAQLSTSFLSYSISLRFLAMPYSHYQRRDRTCGTGKERSLLFGCRRGAVRGGRSEVING